VEKILKDEDEIKEDQEKKEEIEKLRDQLRDHLI